MPGREHDQNIERTRTTSEPKLELGTIWIVQDDEQAYVRSKPRPAVVVQDMVKAGGLDSVTVCIFTTNEERAFYRILVEPDEVNGLDKPSRLMVDKVTTVQKESLRTRIGTLDQTIMDEFYLRLIEFMTSGGVSPNVT